MKRYAERGSPCWVPLSRGNIRIFEKRFDPLNKIGTKSKCSKGGNDEGVFNRLKAFSKSAENKMASMSFSSVYSRISLIKRTDSAIFLLHT